MRLLFRAIDEYTVRDSTIVIKLDCSHIIIDKVMNKHTIGDKLSCYQCMTQFEELEKCIQVIEE